jgi:hypothetical protein
MKTLTATFAARTQTSRSTGKVFSFPARTASYSIDDNGAWFNQHSERVFEMDVIDTCKQATNWPSIRNEYFPMAGFHS